MEIRKEIEGDIETIRALTEKAFAPMPFSSGTESKIIETLREDNQLTLSLVAIRSDQILGQITFSPVTIDGVHEGWFGLGPVSVLPEKQGEGIGSALVLKGLELIKDGGAKGCVLIGDPNYYSRFGFINETGLTYKGLDRKFVQRVTFAAPARDGEVLFTSAFEETTPG
jgi:putative acetyltransferase